MGKSLKLFKRYKTKEEDVKELTDGCFPGAAKNDKRDAKPKHSFVYKGVMDGLAYAMMAGEIKYGKYNYTKGHELTSLTSAISRHLKLIEQGEDLDQDTMDIFENGYTRPCGTFVPGYGVRVEIRHEDCILANICMIKHQRNLGTLTDDRFKGEI